jgi:U32 family peptidase
MSVDKGENIELLAPAGDFESLMAAIQGGADAVYFGIGSLNMRASASRNFRVSDLPEIKKRCSKAGIHSYVTLNTIVFDEDLGEMRQLIKEVKNSGIDAIIASDPAVILEARRQHVPVHISTQANISNIESLRYYAGFAGVVVLARELSLEQVQAICRTVREENICGPSGNLLRIEVFIHGALCMAISGKCYLSLHEKNKSANRGECLQLCRRGYSVTEKEDGYQLDIDNEYIMSPKDLSTITFLDQLLQAGVHVLKIEGRGRSPEYVKTTAKCYREAVDAWLEGSFTREKALAWEEKLRAVFNRGFWEGYYLGKKSGEWSEKYGSHASHRKVYIGKGINYFAKIGVAEFLTETNSLQKGDRIIITGPTTGVMEAEVGEIRIDHAPVEKAVRGDRFSIPVPGIVRRSDKLYKIMEVKR